MNKPLIIDHYKNPRNWGIIADGISKTATNSFCGDEITLSIKINNGNISDAKFEGEGCSICLACGSILTEYIKGKTLEEVKTNGEKYILETIEMDNDSPRKRCATLPFEPIKEM